LYLIEALFPTMVSKVSPAYRRVHDVGRKHPLQPHFQGHRRCAYLLLYAVSSVPRYVPITSPSANCLSVKALKHDSSGLFERAR
jgi:hypothetical protein